MDKPAITYAEHPGAPPGAEVSALANVYRFVLDRKKAVPDRRPEDARERINDARTHTNST